MNPGELNKRITIQEEVKVKDEITKITSTDWKDVKTCWASIDNLYSKEKWNAKQYNLENSLKIKIRYSSYPNLTAKNRIKWGDRLFNIISPDNIKYKNETFIVMVEEVA